jgi:structural maintenance of chromosome 2
MQGKITKVLNMKPAEILGMVEEAAGTRMFEERKDKAMKTMTKKDKKVEEIESVGPLVSAGGLLGPGAEIQLLKEEIDPKLEKLRAEKRSYLEYQKTSSELERLTRLVKAYEWTLAVEKTEKAKDNLAKAQRQVEECKEEITRGGKECEGMESEIKEIQTKREKVRSSRAREVG